VGSEMCIRDSCGGGFDLVVVVAVGLMRGAHG
jgi:hypothetical protein